MAIDRGSVLGIWRNLGGVCGLDRLTDAVIELGLLDEEWRAASARRLAKAEIRKVMREVDEGEELPEAVSVVRTGDDGSRVQVYVQRALMDVSDYEYAVGYRVKMADHFITSAHAMASECKERHGIQIPLPGWLPIPEAS